MVIFIYSTHFPHIIALLQLNICMQGQDCSVLDVLKHPRCEAVINNKVILFQCIQIHNVEPLFTFLS